MTTPTSQLGMSHIQTEFGGSNPIALSEYYGVNANVPGSGTIRMAQFLGISAWAADPTQPSVTATHWHGTFGWGNSPYVLYAQQITKTNDLLIVFTTNTLTWHLDASGTKIAAWSVANGFATTTGSSKPYASIVRTSFNNPNRIYMVQIDTTNRSMITKIANTGSTVAACNLNWTNGATGQANVNFRIWDIAPTSGSSNATTAIYAIAASNTTSTNAAHTILKLNATDMTTIEWGKTLQIGPSDTTTNTRPFHLWTNLDESALFVAGSRSTCTTIMVLSTADGSTQQSWQAPSYGVIRKATSANNIGFYSSYDLYLRSNTGTNVTAITITSTTYRGIPPDANEFPLDIDYDSNLYIGGSGSGDGATANVVAMFAKYNSSLTRQWQIRVRPVDTNNCAGIMWAVASNNRVALMLTEYQQQYNGKKWYVSGYGERRLVFMNAASGNTGTFGRFIVESNTATVFGALAGFTTSSYTFSPRSTYECSFQSRTAPTLTSNTASFSKTTL